MDNRKKNEIINSINNLIFKVDHRAYMFGSNQSTYEEHNPHVKITLRALLRKLDISVTEEELTDLANGQY